MCGVVASYLEFMLGHLQFGLNNIKVKDMALLCSSRLSLTVARMNLLLKGLSEPSVKYNCPEDDYTREVC